MSWWNDIVEWIASPEGQSVLVTVGIPFTAVLLAALIGAGVARSATKRLIAQRDRETRANAVAALVMAGAHAATWSSQSGGAKEHSEQLAAAADIAVRLMPVHAAGMAADWAAHQLADMRTNSVSFSFQAEQSLREYRDRLLQWVDHPRRAKKLFSLDLERWSYASAAPDPVYADQTAWMQEHQGAPTAPAQPLIPAGAPTR